MSVMMGIYNRLVSLLIILAVFAPFCSALKAQFNPNSLTVKISDHQSVKVLLSDLEQNVKDLINDRNILQILSDDESIAQVVNQRQITFAKNENDESWEANFNVSGIFLGSAKVFVELKLQNNQSEFSSDSLSVTVVRSKGLVDEVFMLSMIVFLVVINVNFGAALSLSNIKEILIRPVGPALCCLGQFVFMPVMSYGLGVLLFRDSQHGLGPALSLGLFFCGVAPGGGFSNFWTLLLNGNIDLSIAMTTISTLAAFGMIPLWVFTLGKKIFERANLTVPYRNVIFTAASLIIPLSIGVLIRKYKPNVANFLVKILKPSILILITVVVIAAIFSNLYMFKVVTWQVRQRVLLSCLDNRDRKLINPVNNILQIILAGLILPCLGYLFGWLMGKILCQPIEDCIALSIEVGMQNTTFAIILLNFALEQPIADISAAVPISVAMSTLLTLIAIYLVLQIKLR